jgi:hypothetical protein
MAKKHTLSLLLIGGLSIPVFAGSVNNEPGGGFSSNGLSPTVLSFSEGSNQIFGSNGSGASSVRDYVTFTTPAGLGISAIMMLNTTPLGSLGFIGIQAGSQLTLPTNTMTAAGLLGWRHYQASDVNTDILPFMSVPANGSNGFTIMLPPGSYTLWIQDSSPGPGSTNGTFNYGFDVQLAQVPEPATWGTSLAAVAGATVLLIQRRRFADSR